MPTEETATPPHSIVIDIHLDDTAHVTYSSLTDEVEFNGHTLAPKDVDLVDRLVKCVRATLHPLGGGEDKPFGRCV